MLPNLPKSYVDNCHFSYTTKLKKKKKKKKNPFNKFFSSPFIVFSSFIGSLQKELYVCKTLA